MSKNSTQNIIKESNETTKRTNIVIAMLRAIRKPIMDSISSITSMANLDETKTSQDALSSFATSTDPIIAKQAIALQKNNDKIKEIEIQWSAEQEKTFKARQKLANKTVQVPTPREHSISDENMKKVNKLSKNDRELGE
ncbi:MAG: hypothetical protein ACLTEH_02290 [Clostridia bacterium]